MHRRRSASIIRTLINYQEADKLRNTASPHVTPALPRAGEGKRGPDGHLAYLLRQAAGVVRLRMERALATFGVTQAQFVVLTMLDAYPGASGAELARLGLLTPQTIHGITTNLLRAGSIAREASPVHGRVQILALTPPGRDLLERCKKKVAELECGLAENLTGQDEAVIRRWLVSLAVPEQG